MLVTVVQRALDQNLDLALPLRVSARRERSSSGGRALLPTADLEATGTALHQRLRVHLVLLRIVFPATAEISGSIQLVPQRAGNRSFRRAAPRQSRAAAELQAAQADQVGTRITALPSGGCLPSGEGVSGTACGGAATHRYRYTSSGVGRSAPTGGSGGRSGSCPSGSTSQASQVDGASLRVALEAQLNRLDVLMVLSRERTPELSKPGAIPESPQSLVRPTPGCPASQTRHHCSRAPACRVERANRCCDFGLLPEGFAFRRAWFRQHSGGTLFNGKAFQPIGRERCDGGFSFWKGSS